MDKVLTIIHDKYFYTIEHWVGSIPEGVLNLDEFKDCNGLDKNYLIGIYCLLHKNLMSESIIYFKKSTSHHALFILGELYCSHILKYDRMKGLEYLNKAYTQGNLDAGFSLVKIYAYGSNETAKSNIVAKIICDDLHEKKYVQKCTTKRDGFYTEYATILYELQKYDEMNAIIELAIANDCTCCYHILGAMEDDDKKRLELYLRQDRTKCYNINYDWNVAEVYSILNNWTRALKHYIMAIKNYSDVDEVNSCVSRVERIIKHNPDALAELIKNNTIICV